MLDAITNHGRWSETAAVRFPKTAWGPRILESMLSIIKILSEFLAFYGRWFRMDSIVPPADDSVGQYS